MKKLTTAAALALSVTAMPVSAQSEVGLDELLENGAIILRAVGILEAVEKSILLTEKRCADLGPGWQNYDQLNGRFALAAGVGKDGNDEREFELHEQGGTYRHTLTEAEMPGHSHAYRDKYLDGSRRGPELGDDDDRERRYSRPGDRTGNTGGNAPHNNMPPFRVMSFCHLVR